MTTTLEYFVIYLAGMVVIGVPLGIKSFNLLVEEQFGHFGGIPIGWKLTLFPSLNWSIWMSEHLPLFHILLGIHKKEDADFNRLFWYVIITAIFWPVRITWNLIGIVILVIRLFGILTSV